EKLSQKEVVPEEKSESEISRKTPLISKEKEADILGRLEEFEKSEKFLNRDMSLAVLAGQLDTNTKYLSEIINKYKEKNYNNYINELRINYIAYLLKTDSAYLNYKVSYLAEKAGFSSHSAFTTVFKSVTGISPNTYIQQLTQNK
ncbi:MAG: AraC family transcriptional regulator, partial [Chryseobacterium sp.]